jgi:UDP-N-acetylmuramoylalanine-D-glutamate ligase
VSLHDNDHIIWSCYILKGDDALMDADELPLIGQHNIVNVLAALALGRQIGLNTDSPIKTTWDIWLSINANKAL